MRLGAIVEAWYCISQSFITLLKQEKYNHTTEDLARREFVGERRGRARVEEEKRLRAAAVNITLVVRGIRAEEKKRSLDKVEGRKRERDRYMKRKV